MEMRIMILMRPKTRLQINTTLRIPQHPVIRLLQLRQNLHDLPQPILRDHSNDLLTFVRADDIAGLDDD